MIQLPRFAPSSALVLPTFLAGLFALAACTAAPRPVQPGVPGERTETLAAEGLDRLQPADVAVAPIENLTGLAELPVDDLRAALAQGLVQRLYTPLALDFVDKHWVDASFRGVDVPDATLYVTVLGWNENSLASKGELAAELELKLVEGGTAEGRLLWGRRLQRIVDVAPSGNRPAGLRRDLFPIAVRELASRALQELPERDLRTAPREAGLLRR